MWNKETYTKCEQALSTALNFSFTLHNYLYVSRVVGGTSFWNVLPMIIQYYCNFTHVEITLWKHKYLVTTSRRQRHIVFDFADVRIEVRIHVSSENSCCKFFLTSLLSSALVQTNMFCAFLGAFAKFRKATISFVMSVRPSVILSTWINSAPTGRILMKFDIWGRLFENLSIKFKFH